MKKVIVDTGRVGGGRKRRLPRDPETWPTKEGMRRLYTDTKSLGDRLAPLYSYLDRQVGRPWAAVWSDICVHADPRGVLGYHLRTHVKGMVRVRPNGNDFRYGLVGPDGRPAKGGRSWRFHDFWVDEKGVLRKG